MKKLFVLFLLLIACSSTRHNFTPIDKCNHRPGYSWQYDYTEYWTTTDNVYGYKWVYDWETGDFDYKYTQTGTTIVSHSQDVYACKERR